MKVTRAILTAMAVLALAGCASRQAATPTGADRYRRAPIREVGEEQLKNDGRLIDALTLVETGHVDEALAAYTKLTHDAPDMAAAWYGQSQLLLMRGWTDSALHCARRAVALQGENEWYLMALAQSAAAAGEVEEAVSAIDRVERIKGFSETLSLQKQRLWENAGRHDKALKEMEALADAMPQESRYQAIMAEMNMQRKNYKKARRYYDRILAATPDDEYIHLQLAEYYKQTGHPADADSEMVKAFSNPNLETRTKMQLLTSFYTEEEFYGSRREVCLRLMELALSQCEDPEEYALYYGDALMRQERYDEAASQLALALRRDSSRYEVWEGLLICLASVPSRQDEMEDYARRAERLFPMHTLPHHLHGLCALRAKRYDEAIEVLELAVKWGFRNGYLETETYALLTEACYQGGQYDRCWKHFETYLATHPNDWNMLNNYAYYLAERGLELEKALAMSRRTIEAEPDNANSLDTYAWLLHLLGRDAEALPYMKKALRLNPTSETLQQHMQAISNK